MSNSSITITHEQIADMADESLVKKIVIVGGVAGGASAAARLRRLDETAEIVLLERGGQVSFANCGMPYYIGGVIEDRDKLLLQTPESLYERFRINVRVNSEVLEIEPDAKNVRIQETLSGRIYSERYDSLILAPGAAPIRPSLLGIDLPNVFTLRNMADCDAVKSYIAHSNPKRALVVGGGFIGVEMAENFCHLGMEVTLVEMADQVLAPMDPEMASYLHRHLMEKGVNLVLSTGLTAIEKAEQDKLTCRLSNGNSHDTDIVALAIGILPDNKLATQAGLKLGVRGGIMVDGQMRTSIPDIYAVGDAVLSQDFISGEDALIPLAGPANRQGRIAAGVIAGRDFSYRGTLGTSVCKVFDLTAASTGKNEKQLKQAGISYDKVYTHPSDHAGYYPGSTMIHFKLLFSPETGKVLGAQGVGLKGVDKRIDVIATAIYAGLTVEDLENLELAYAPPFSAAKDVVNLTGFVASNVRRGDLKQFFAEDTAALMETGDYFLLDVRTPGEVSGGTIQGAVNIPVDNLRERLEELPQDKKILVFCKVGLRGYVACRILTQHGFDAYNLSGGYTTWTAEQA